MAGDISRLKLFTVNFIYVSQNHVCRNKFKFKLERIPKFIPDCLDTWVIVKVLNFFITVQTVFRDNATLIYS